MKYLTAEDLKKFDELEQLEKTMHDLHNSWLNEVRKRQKNNQPIDDTRPLFEKHLKAYREWKACLDKHNDTFLPSRL